MKKIWGFLLVLLGMILAFRAPTTVEAADFKIQKYHTTYDIQKNGDVDVTQRLNYQFDGDFHGVYFRQGLKKAKGATTPRVYIDDAGFGAKEIKQSNSGAEDTFKLSKTDSAMNIKVYHEISTGNVNFIYKYRLHGVVTNYADTALMEWKMIDDGWDNSLHNVVLTVNLPQKNVPKLQAWGHGPLEGHTTVDRKKGRVVMKLTLLPSHEAVGIRMLFPTSVTATNQNVVNKKVKAQAIAKERQWIDDQKAKAKRQKIIFRALMSFGILVILIIYLYRFIAFKKDRPNKHLIPTPLYHTFDEPPFIPSMTKIILDHARKADSLSLSADLLNEAGRHRMKIEKVGITYQITALKEPSNEFFKYLIEEIGDGKKVTLKQIKSAATSYGTKDEIVRKFEKWSEDAAKGRKKYIDIHNFNLLTDYRTSAIASSIILFIMFIISLLFEKNFLIYGGAMILVAALTWLIYFISKKKITVYTDEGEEAVNKIRAFKRMLSDIDDIKMAEVGDLILWEQFLPYAVVFGVSDKVIKAMKLNFSAEEIDQSVVLPFYIGSTSFIGSASNGFQAAFVGAIGAGGSASISGGSGGFSGGSMGGFGGGSSGGAF